MTQGSPTRWSQPLGTLVALVGGSLDDPRASDVLVTGFGGIETAGDGEITFAAGRWRSLAARSRASVLVIDERVPEFAGIQVLHKDPNLAFARIVTHLLHAQAVADPGIHPRAFVHPSAMVAPTATVQAGAVIDADAVVGASTYIGAQVYVGQGAVIGASCQLHPGARVMARCRLGDRVVLQPNAVVGGDGFGYATDERGRHHKIPHTGNAILEDDVELGAGATVDRARFDSTRVGRGTKIDNLVMVAHNVQIGTDGLIVAQAGIAGSSKLGDRVVLGGHVGVAGHLSIGDDVQVAGYSGISGNLEGPGAYFGIPAVPFAQGRKAAVLHTKLPELNKKIRDLEARLAALERPSDGTPA